MCIDIVVNGITVGSQSGLRPFVERIYLPYGPYRPNYCPVDIEKTMKDSGYSVINGAYRNDDPPK